MKAFISKAGLFLKEQRCQYFLSLFLFMLLFGFGYLHGTKGIDLTDEGMYLAAPMRYALGDIPFRNEVMNVMRPFDVLVSPVFMLFPDISLLQMRLLGNTLHLVSIFLLFIFLAKFAPSFLVALSCGVMFLMNNFYGILSPSYNSLSSDFSLISLTLWLFAMSSTNKLFRLTLSFLGGFSFSVAVMSYLPISITVIVPLAFVITMSISSNKKRSDLIQSSFILTGTFLIVMMLIFVILFFTGILPDIIEWSQQVTKANILRIRGPFLRMLDLLKEFYSIAPKGLMLLGMFLVSMFIIPSKSRKGDVVVAIFAIISLLLFLYLLSPMRHGDIWYSTSYLLSFAVPLALLVLFFDKVPDSKITENLSWNIVRNILIVWGIISMVVYGLCSDNGLHACPLGVTPLFLAGSVSLYRTVNYHANITEAGKVRKFMWPAMIFVVIAAFTIEGANYYHNYVYGEAEVNSLTHRFNHPRLAGVYSTTEKVRVIEELLAYLNGKVKPNDYFLAYNYIPMLYFLTHTRPAYGAAWARDDWLLSLRESLLNRMIKNNRIPEYCVRMLSNPWDDWKSPMSYDEKSPLDLYVSSNYYLEKIIYPFEIWRRGKGPKLRVFNQKTPDFNYLFFKWMGPVIVNNYNLSKKVPPLIVQKNNGDFNFKRILDRNTDIIRISSSKSDENNKREIQFGYTLGENGFNLKLHPGQNVVFIISVRLSEKPKKPVTLFIQDRTSTWDRNSVSINKTSWEQYIVSKRIRDEATAVSFGINWRPDTENEWLEVKDVRIHIVD